MPKLMTLINEQLRELLRLNNMEPVGTKTEIVEALTTYFGSNEIDKTTLQAIFPDKKVQADLANMNKMMKSLADSVNKLNTKVSTLSIQQISNNVPAAEADEGDDNENQQTDEQNLSNNDGEDAASVISEENDPNENISVQDSEVEYQFSPQIPHYSVKEMAETIPEFDPTKEFSMSAEQFIQHVESAKTSYQWNEKGLLLAVYSRLKGVARMWFDCRPKLFTHWNEFRDELLSEFGSTYDEAEISYKMSRTVRRVDEKIIDFCFRIHALGRRFNLSESAIIRYARDGMKHNALQSAIAAKKFTTMKQFRDTISEYFANMPSTSKQRDHVETKPKGFIRKIEKREDGNHYSDNRDFHCYNCNEKGHMARYCPKPQKKQRCANCQRTSHKTDECPERKPNITLNRANINTIADVDDTYKSVVKTVIVNGKPVVAFLDSGSPASLIQKKCAMKFGELLEGCIKNLVGFAGGTYVVTQKMRTTMTIDEKEFSTNLFVVEDNDIPEDILIGRDVLCEKGNRIIIENGNCRVESANTLPVNNINERPTNSLIDGILSENRKCIANELSELGKCSVDKMKIELTTDEPICMKPYRIAFAKREIVANIIQELLDHGIIRPSKSNYASPVVLVEKKNGEHRLCVDYRRLNKITKRIPFPIPNMEEQFAQLAGNSYFSALDLRMGYHQIEMDEDSKKYTAFVTTDGHYEFNRMPFGLVNAPAVFQRVMNTIAAEMKPGEILTYLDDIIIPSVTIPEGVEKLKRFLKVLAESGLTLRLEKCDFLSTEIQHLGHIINGNGIRPGNGKIAAIQKFKIPENVTEVRRFLGLTGFFRKFVRDYAIISKPLTMLLNKTAIDNFEWKNEQQQAFEKLINILSNAPLLVLYDVTKEHEVHTDACTVGLAGVLLQSNDGKSWQPVMYFSRHCTSAERVYHSYELEVLAVVESLERFRLYLLGKTFRIITDCSAIVKTKEQHELKPRIARWWLKLQEYSFDLVHRPGVRLAHVDAMSRSPVEFKEPCEPAGYTYTITDEQSDWVVALQHRDERAKHILDVLKGNAKSEDELQFKNDYEVTNGRLYYKTQDGPRFYAPKAVRWNLVRHYHDEMGHFAIEKTLQRLAKCFWFPKMRKLVKEYINACISCCYNKAQRAKPEGELHCSEPTPIPFRMLHIDHLGPFVRSKKGNTHLLVLTDAFSKFSVLKAVRNTSTNPVINAMNEVISYFGLPEKLISDRGTAFTSKTFNKFCHENQICHIKTAVRTPRANGQVERTNATILSALKTSTREPKLWDENLVKLQWILNSQPNATTRFTPNELVFNFDLKDVVHNNLVAAISEDIKDETIHSITEKYTQAAQNIANERQKWKMRFDKTHAKPTHYHEGDIVVITNVAAATGESRKLEPRHRGPYIIKRVLGNDRYVVADVPGLQIKNRPFNSVYSSDQLKPWCNGYPELVYTDDEEASEEN